MFNILPQYYTEIKLLGMQYQIDIILLSVNPILKYDLILYCYKSRRTYSLTINVIGLMTFDSKYLYKM